VDVDPSSDTNHATFGDVFCFACAIGPFGSGKSIANSNEGGRLREGGHEFGVLLQG